MSADTLAERIRERARILSIDLTGDRQRGKHRISHYAKKIGDFTLSELSAAEEARAELQNKLLVEATGHMKTQASLKAANERWMAEQDARKSAEQAARKEERDSIVELFQGFVNDCNDGKWQPYKFIEAIRNRE